MAEISLSVPRYDSTRDELSAILIGYRVTLEVHGIGEELDFWPRGAFAEWRWARLGRHSSFGWAVEIGREAEATQVSPLDLFFSFVDEFRAGRRPELSRRLAR